MTEQKPDHTLSSPDKAFKFDFSKMSNEALLALGQATALNDVIAIFGAASRKTLDLREKQVLQKVIDTLETHRVSSSRMAIALAEKCKAIRKSPIVQGNDETQ